MCCVGQVSFNPSGIYVTIYRQQLHFSNGKTRVNHSPEQNGAFDGLFLASTSVFDTVVQSILSKK